jgi:hypothetical protein
MRYFDKDFFKFTLGFLGIVSLSLLIIMAVSAYAAADVSFIAFTTEPQSINPNELSDPITIQTQDANGNSFQTSETIDLVFESSSPTGEFLGSTGKAAQKFIRRNTANKTFYYRDSAEGSFTLSISARGRDSLKEWSPSQPITVSGIETSASVENLPPLPPPIPLPTPPKKSEVPENKEPGKISSPIIPSTPATQTLASPYLVPQPTSAPQITPITSKEAPKENTPAFKKENKEKKPTNQTASVALSAEETIATGTASTSPITIFESPKSKTWWSRIITKLTNFIKSIFSK